MLRDTSVQNSELIFERLMPQRKLNSKKGGKAYSENDASAKWSYKHQKKVIFMKIESTKYTSSRKPTKKTSDQQETQQNRLREKAFLKILKPNRQSKQ